MNPMEAYRREQKKKELKKHRIERKKDKETKLGSMNLAEIKEQLKNLKRQVAANPTDGPSRKRKQELEDTLRAAVKRQKKIMEVKQQKLTDVLPPRPMSMTELTEGNKDKYQNPENSIYYHPTLNPFGAPPPGMPQRYRNTPPKPVGLDTGVARGHPRQGRSQQHRFQDQTRLSRADGRSSPASMQPRIMANRPGKRPPLPQGPSPPGTIQVASRPPLPIGAILARPPPPPPVDDQIAGSIMSSPLRQPCGMFPPPPSHPEMTIAVHERETKCNQAEVHMNKDGVVAFCPTTDRLDVYDSRMEGEQETDENRAKHDKSRSQLRSLVPVALRKQRQAFATPSSNVTSRSKATGVPAPHHPPAHVAGLTMSSAGVILFSPPYPTTTAIKASVSKEFDTFIEETKELM
ncbi:unnamed protein product [Peronospora belbahrii]|nr:unnamed protein product [Peronospora belbahrii]